MVGADHGKEHLDRQKGMEKRRSNVTVGAFERPSVSTFNTPECVEIKKS